jgi:uncharacterized protein YjbJ (UPF0337 family)
LQHPGSTSDSSGRIQRRGLAEGGYMGSGTIDKAKGRAKEAAGALTGDRKLKSEGKLDQAVGKVKDVVDRVADKTKRTLGRSKTKR